MQNTTAIAERFCRLDFHDEIIVCMTVLPSQSRENNTGSLVEFRLSRGQKTKVLRFIGCANLRVAADFDVLAHNFPWNTSKVEAHTDKDAMLSLMQSQKHDWRVKYEGSGPLDWKAEVMNEFVSFRVQFFGGVVEIIAGGYEVDSVEKQAAAPALHLTETASLRPLALAVELLRRNARS